MHPSTEHGDSASQFQNATAMNEGVVCEVANCGQIAPKLYTMTISRPELSNWKRSHHWDRSCAIVCLLFAKNFV